jgi:hypothetical protein
MDFTLNDSAIEFHLTNGYGSFTLNEGVLNFKLNAVSEAGGSFRLLEDDEFRLLEDGSFRLLE